MEQFNKLKDFFMTDQQKHNEEMRKSGNANHFDHYQEVEHGREYFQEKVEENSNNWNLLGASDDDVYKSFLVQFSSIRMLITI